MLFRHLEKSYFRRKIHQANSRRLSPLPAPFLAAPAAHRARSLLRAYAGVSVAELAPPAVPNSGREEQPRSGAAVPSGAGAALRRGAQTAPGGPRTQVNGGYQVTGGHQHPASESHTGITGLALLARWGRIYRPPLALLPLCPPASSTIRDEQLIDLFAFLIFFIFFLSFWNIL